MIRVVLFIRRHRYLVAFTLEENTANHFHQRFTVYMYIISVFSQIVNTLII
nr:MAG TPA: hypothetical protein [Caudoviricetes sp.]